MDLEQLSKTQIILLTLLVSFVTSIATGIVTVSLVNQAPPGITQTVNRIVERTVERVVPDVKLTQGAAVVTTEKTVVVKEDDLIAEAIGKVSSSVIRIVPQGKDDGEVVARGVIVRSKGVAITDRSSLSHTESYKAILATGERVSFTVRAADEQSSIAVLDLAAATSTKYQAATLIDTSTLKLGTSVLLLGGTTRDAIETGIISALPQSGGPERDRYLEASVSASTPGSLLLTLFGEIAAMTTSESLILGKELYTTSGAIKAALE